MRVSRLVVAVLSSAVLGLTGCGSDEEPSGAGEATQSGAPTESASGSPSVSPSEEASEDPYAGVAPATGPLLEMESLVARLPEGWKREEVTSQLHTGSEDETGVALAEVAPIVPPPFDELARQSSRNRIDVKKLDRKENVWIAGREWFRLEGWGVSPAGGRYYIVDYGIPLVDSAARLTFTLPPSMSPKERVEFMEPVLASVEWR